MWLAIIGLSTITGVLCGLFLSEHRALTWAGALPWLGLLAWLLFAEYVLPYREGGASMWPIAQLIGGTVAAGIGMLAAMLTRAVRAKSGSRSRY